MRLGAAEGTAENNVIRVSAEGVYAAISTVRLSFFQFLRPLSWCVRTLGKPIFRLARYANNRAVA
jgi:hypothetical protein